MNRGSLPNIAELPTLTREEQIALLDAVDARAAEIAALRGALHALLLEPPRPAPLLDAKETAHRLGVSVDTVRDRGAEWGIEVFLAEGLCRYDPMKVEELRQRRRPSNHGDRVTAKLRG